MMALEGIKVIDFTRYAPGQYCTTLLGDLGADVLRIEEPAKRTGRRAEQGVGVEHSLIEPFFADVWSPHNAFNRNKRSIVLNLKADAAREIVHRLAEDVDVVVEEFRPGVSKRLGVDYATLSKVNPRIVYCSSTGFGQDGPYRDVVGHDINYLAIAGTLSIIGEKGGKPVVPSNFIGDMAGGGMQCAVGILSAIIARQSTGRGQYVDNAMTDGILSLMIQTFSWYHSWNRPLKRGDEFTTGGSPALEVYEASDGRYIALGCFEPWFWVNLCKALGREDFIPYQEYEGKKDEIFTAFRAIFRTRTRDEWFEYLKDKDIAVSKVLTLEEVEHDPQVRHRRMIVEVDHPKMGKVKEVGIGVKLSDTPGAIRNVLAGPGEHTDQVLAGLKYSPEKIAELRASGAIE